MKFKREVEGGRGEREQNVERKGTFNELCF